MSAPEDIVVIGGTQWTRAANQPPLLMVRALLAAGHRVLYLCRETSGPVLRAFVRPLTADDRRLALGALRGRMAAVNTEPRAWIAPLRGELAVLPLTSPEWSRRYTVRRLGKFLERTCAELGFERPVLWFYWPSLPELLDLVPHGSSVYDCIDDHADYPKNRRLRRANASVRAMERRLVERVDQVVAVSPGLAESKRSMAKDVLEAHSAVELETVDSALAVAERPAELAACARPIVGYAGGMAERIDWKLVNALAERRPDWSLVFVGGPWPSDPMPPNVHLFGQQPYERLLRFVREFSVGIVPFVANDFTRSNFPMKVLDYLAVGKPVIGSPLPALESMTATGAVVTERLDPDAWEARIEASMHRFGGLEPLPRAALAEYTPARRVEKILTALRRAHSAA